ncbi:MAG: sensor histidine kinase [Lachnospiraceae bacterium]
MHEAPWSDLQKRIELVLVCERQVIADADEVKLTLALSNFIENAIKYNRDNGWVHVKLDADHKQFTVIVEDCGIGIPREDQAYIFERFYRVDKSHSREIGGTGLGLSIARSTVLLHKGAVEVESEPDVGTKFTIRIPLTYIPN